MGITFGKFQFRILDLAASTGDQTMLRNWATKEKISAKACSNHVQKMDWATLAICRDAARNFLVVASNFCRCKLQKYNTFRGR
jgi:hypothetical protein